MENNSCHQWIQDEIVEENITLNVLNKLHVRRNIGGISMLTCFSVLGLVGNVHVLYVYSRQYKQSTYRIYVLFLAILDVINCAIVAPLVIVYLFHPLTFPSDIFCKVFRTILYFMAISSTLSLVSIALERFRKIRYPFKKHLSATQVKLLCLGSLIIAAVLSWPAPILWGLSHVESGVQGIQGRRCFTEDKFKENGINFQGLYNCCLIVFYFIVSSTLIGIYMYIGINIQKQYQFRDSQWRISMKDNDAIKSNNYTARKSTLTLCIVTITYVVSALPHHLLALLIFLIPNFDCTLSILGSQLFYTFIWSYFFNSVVNPFIYGIRDRKFRFAVKNMYRR